jgi:hypothetical protein
MMDICVNFRLGYFDSNGHEVMNPSKITKRYLKSWFPIDFMSSLPYDLFADSLSGLSGLRAAKFFKMYRLIRLAKLSKLMKSKALLEALEDWVIAHRQNLRVGKMFLLTFIVTHFNACAWAFVGRMSKNCNRKGWYCSYGDMGDDGEDYYSWMQREMGSRYLTAMYFSMTTISTVGYGDIKPVTDEERCLAIFSMIVGGSFYGYVVANMSSLVSATDSNSKAYFEKMDQVTSYMQVRKFPMELAYRVRKHFKHTLNEKTALDERQILNELSTRLRREVCLYLVNDIVYTVDLFQGLNPETFANVVINLKPMQCQVGDTIFHQGDYGHEMYIVISGRLACKFERKDANLKPIKDRILKPGDYFGELAAFDLQNKRTCTILATAFSEIYTLSREDMYQQFARQPHVMDRMRTAALEHARATYLDIYGSKKKKFKNLIRIGAGLKSGKPSLAAAALAAKGKLDLNKEETDGSVEENKSEEAEGKRVLSLFNRKGDAAKEKLEKQAAEGHERKLAIIENLQKMDDSGGIPAYSAGLSGASGTSGGGDDGGGDADDVASVRQGMDAMKAQLCDSRKASVKALYETQSIWFNCVNQDLIALCKMLASLKADPMNQEMMRGAYALAVSAVTQMRLCNDTMGTFLGPADAGPLTEEEQKKVLADLESSVALPVEKVLGVASSNETTELQNLMDLQAEAAANGGAAVDHEGLQEVLDDWLAAIPIKDKPTVWKGCLTVAKDAVQSENNVVIENQSIPSEIKESHLVRIRAKQKALDALADPSAVDPGLSTVNLFVYFVERDRNEIMCLFCFTLTGTTSLGRFQLQHASLQTAFILCFFKQDFKCSSPWRLIEALTELDHRVGLWKGQHAEISHGMLGLHRGGYGLSGDIPCNLVFKAFSFMAELDLSHAPTDSQQVKHPFP